MAKTKKVVEMESPEDNTTVETCDVEVTEMDGLLGMNMEAALQRIQAKYKKSYHLAWVHHEDARMTHNRWQYLKFKNGGSDVEECKFEEAEKRKAFLVLCWRKRVYQDMIDNDLRRRNIESKNREKIDVKSRAAQEIDNLGFRDKMKISNDVEN